MTSIDIFIEEAKRSIVGKKDTTKQGGKRTSHANAKPLPYYLSSDVIPTMSAGKKSLVTSFIETYGKYGLCVKLLCTLVPILLRYTVSLGPYSGR